MYGLLDPTSQTTSIVVLYLSPSKSLQDYHIFSTLKNWNLVGQSVAKIFSVKN